MTTKKQKQPLIPDRYYHIYNRGNNKEKLFYHSGDYFFFLGKYKEYVSPVADTYAFCLLPNHFHFLIKTREDLTNLKSPVPNQLRKLFICYTYRINSMHQRTGGLFTKNYQRIEIHDEIYMTELINYIHKNPIKHGVQSTFENYLYSSYRIILSDSETNLMREDVISWFGGRKGFIDYHNSDLIDPREFTLLNLENREDVL
jgi:putative transposase